MIPRHSLQRLLLGLLAAVSCDSGTLPPLDGTFAFAVFADAPYGFFEEIKVRKLIRRLNSADFAWVIHAGDILWYPCSDAEFQKRFDMFQESRHPFIYTPGDNEWTDCHERIAGGYRPLDRLSSLRAIFFADPFTTTGGRTFRLDSQAADSLYADFPENARWVHQRIVFATLHVVGSDNGRERFVGRSWQDDAAAARRDSATIAWLREAFRAAGDIDARGVVLVMHADPSFELPPSHDWRAPYDAFLQVLEEEVERFTAPVLLIHGDDHTLIVDKPLVRRTSGRVIENFTRLEVFGSPDVGWVSVVVDTSRADLFDFQPHLVRLLF